MILCAGNVWPSHWTMISGGVEGVEVAVTMMSEIGLASDGCEPAGDSNAPSVVDQERHRHEKKHTR
jgi:hypothetical protein